METSTTNGQPAAAAAAAAAAAHQPNEHEPVGPFNVLEWHPNYISCITWFLDHGQHNAAVQVVAAFINIQLPFQWRPYPISTARAAIPAPPLPQQQQGLGVQIPERLPSMIHPHEPSLSLIPYLRRLVVTGQDTSMVLHGFFGGDWQAGIGAQHEVERRNFLFASKSDNWLKVKSSYDMDDGQTVPFMKPLQNVGEKEIVSAESSWSEWLAQQDWMLGDRAPAGSHMSGVPRAGGATSPGGARDEHQHQQQQQQQDMQQQQQHRQHDVQQQYQHEQQQQQQHQHQHQHHTQQHQYEQQAHQQQDAGVQVKQEAEDGNTTMDGLDTRPAPS